MNLLEIRTEFVQRVGRYDLVVDTTDYADSGADKFINEGIDFISKKINNKNVEATIFRDIGINDYFLNLERCRSIRDVWVRDSEKDNKLLKLSMFDFRDMYDGPLSGIDTGFPTYYTIGPIVATDGDPDSLAEYLNTSVVNSKDIQTGVTNSIIFGPPADGDYTISVSGLFKSSPLVSNTDFCYWTINYSAIVILAAQYCLERSYRNITGARDILEAIMLELVEVDKDSVEEDIADVIEMEG